ncbi:MAG: hypothetical protein ABR543_14210 [Gemmatimonadaceae bacterium]
MRPYAKTLRAFSYPALLFGATVLGGCDDPFIPDFNNPSLVPVIASQAQLQAQVSGILAGDREFHAFSILILETMGRDAYRIDVADPRYLQHPLGQFSPGAFIVDFTWNANYRTIRAAQALVSGIDASSFSNENKAATRGFARTMQALQYLRLIEQRDTLGLPIALGTGARDAIRCKPVVLDHIIALLDSAKTDLAAGGAAFPFILPSGFTDFGTFNTPATFLEFNRALSAKAQLYKGFAAFATGGTINTAALNAALTALDESFESQAAPLRNGVYHVYSTRSGDLQNGNFDLTVYRVNPKVLSQAEAGDRRLSKIRQDPTFQKSVSGASSDIIFTNVSGPTTPLPIVINEQLILIRAQVLWGLNRDLEALGIVNFIRQTSGGLLPKLPFVNRLDLLREILKQKRYSLLFESGDRLVDYRMSGLFAELGPELNPPQVGPTVIPFPQAEIDARSNELSCSA